MKNLVLFDIAQTDEELQRPIPKRIALVMLLVLGAIAVALIIIHLT
jgi:hypothetical protein